MRKDERGGVQIMAEAQAIADRMKNDLQRLRNASLLSDDELPPLTQKQLDRMAAFAQRDMNSK